MLDQRTKRLAVALDVAGERSEDTDWATIVEADAHPFLGVGVPEVRHSADVGRQPVMLVLDSEPMGHVESLVAPP